MNERRLWYLLKAYVKFSDDTPGWYEYAIIHARDNSEAAAIASRMLVHDREVVAVGDENAEGTYFGDVWEDMTTDISEIVPITDFEKSMLVRLCVAYLPNVADIRGSIREERAATRALF